MKRAVATFLLMAFPISIAYADQYRGFCGASFYPGGGMIIWLITIALAAILIYFIYRKTSVTSLNTTGSSPDVMSIIKTRLAKGEITEDEYDRLKNRISG